MPREVRGAVYPKTTINLFCHTVTLFFQFAGFRGCDLVHPRYSRQSNKIFYSLLILTAYWVIVHGFQAIINQNLRGLINYRLHGL